MPMRSRPVIEAQQGFDKEKQNQWQEAGGNGQVIIVKNQKNLTYRPS